MLPLSIDEVGIDHEGHLLFTGHFDDFWAGTPAPYTRVLVLLRRQYLDRVLAVDVASPAPYRGGRYQVPASGVCHNWGVSAYGARRVWV